MPYKNRDVRLKYHRRYSRKHYNFNKPYYDAKKLRQRKRAKEFIRSIRRKLKCARCSEKDPCCIDLHHPKPAEKEYCVATLANRGWCIERIEKEIAKCIPLCANCHRKEHKRLRVYARVA